MSKKVKSIMASVLIGLTLLGVGCGTSSYVKAKEEAKYNQTIVISEKTKVASKESIVEGIREVAKLKMLEVQTSKVSKLQTGSFFKKTQEVKFRLVHSYFMDFSTIAFDNVIINNNDIKLFMRPIEIETSFNESQTEYGQVQKGLITLGDLKITPEEMESIKTEVKKEANEEALRSAEYMGAKEKAEKIVEDTILKITKLQYNVKIVFVE